MSRPVLEAQGAKREEIQEKNTKQKNVPRRDTWGETIHPDSGACELSCCNFTHIEEDPDWDRVAGIWATLSICAVAQQGLFIVNWVGHKPLML